MILSPRISLSISLTVLLVALVAVLPSAAFASTPLGGEGGITGVVFFDANGNGEIDSADDHGLQDMTVQLFDADNTLLTSVPTDSNGLYTFSGLNAGSYTVTQILSSGYVSTTATSRMVSVGAAVVSGVNFGVTLPMTIWGTIFQDNNGDGHRGWDEPSVSGAIVKMYNDANNNDLIDIGEAALGAATSDAQGNYLIPAIAPGQRILLVRLPGGAESNASPLTLSSSEVGAAELLYNIAIPLANLQGTVFNDANGNEMLDPDEATLAGVVVQLLPAASGDTAVAAAVLLTTTTNGTGQYFFANLLQAAYQVSVDSAALPTGWVLSQDPSALVPALTGGMTTTLDIGTYDPRSVAPMSVGDWKREWRQQGRWQYTVTMLTAFASTAETQSRVFSETVVLKDAILLGGANGLSKSAWKALKEHAAFWMNLTSGRLLEKTPVALGSLSAATTVGQARDEIETIFLASASTDADYERARQIVRALNSGSGVGYGLQKVSALVHGTYRGAEIASRLKPGGEIVDLAMDGPVALLKWSPGSVDSSNNVLRAQVRIKAKSFQDGGVLEVVQRLPDGRQIILGTARPAVWNKDVNATFVFSLFGISTVGDLVNAELYLYARDIDGGKSGRVKVDSAEMVFQY